MKKPFFARHALLLLCVVFFCVPFGLRGARQAVQSMKNDVKDWLPADFEETAELDWFRQHFMGEQFVVISWEGCYGAQDDESFKSLIDKFFPEIPPSQRGKFAKDQQIQPNEDSKSFELPAQLQPTRAFLDDRLGMYVRQLRPADLVDDPEFVGNQLGLYQIDKNYTNWGGQNEKWLKTADDRWVYLTPDGQLYSWQADSSPVASVARYWRRLISGGNQLHGQLLTSLGPEDGPWYYNNPDRLTARLFKSVTTGPGLLSELTKEDGPLEGDVPEALRRLKGSLFGPDGKQTCLVVTLTDTAKKDVRRVLGRGLLGKPRGKLIDLAEQAGIHPPLRPTLLPPPLSLLFPQLNQPSPTLKLGGPPVDNVAIDEEGQITLVRLVGLSVILGLVLSWVCFRSVAITIMVFFVGGVSAVMSLAMVAWSGSSVDAVLMSMPSLVYVLGLSGAVHIVNYYRESTETHDRLRAPGRALSLGWRPCTLASLTTALGLISLYTSNILPIRKFGLYSALGVLGTLAILFIYLPSALQLWAPTRRDLPDSHDVSDSSRLDVLLDRFWTCVAHYVLRHYRAVCVVCIGLLIVFAVGLSKINTSVQLLNLFDSNAKIIKDYQWLEANLGKLVPMEIVVRVKPDVLQVTSRNLQPVRTSSASSSESQRTFPLNFLERMEIAEQVRDELDLVFGPEAQDILGGTMLASTFARLPTTRSPSARSAISRSLESRSGEFMSTDYFEVDPEDQAELWRVSLRLGALNDVDYGQFVSQLKRVVEPVLSAYRFRQRVLGSVDQQSDGKRIRGARVYFLGANQRNDESSKQQPAESVEHKSTEVDQTGIFVKTLARTLRNKGLAIRPFPRLATQPDKWTKALSAADCVVLVQNVSVQELQLVKKHARLFVDARDHLYYPDVSQTAAQQEAAVSAVYTGLVPIVYKAQATLLRSLINSTVLAFVMIAVVMIVLLMSLSGGLFSMLPNVFPVVMIFGFMGWMDIMVDIGSMMTASVAMGVAVDDTIHFLTWFRHGLKSGHDRHSAILLAYRRVATAMTQTTAIGGLGLSIFAFSTFTPTQRFGFLMLTLLFMALIGDLVFLPALLASPLGRVFRARRQPKEAGLSYATSSGVGALDVAPEAEPHTPEQKRPRDQQPSAHERWH